MREFCRFETVDLEQVGNRIKKIRLQNDLTVEQFAEILSVSENAVYKWQRGETAPDIINFGYISSRFEVSLDYLIMGRGDGDEPSPLDICA
ncbi:MAG: helix-turn-helix transcriptional regulator [Lachnospiraceae bacterium]|nr:helix-turn-helix transcriptional regulator [Lachnospiraceae bacterium]